MLVLLLLQRFALFFMTLFFIAIVESQSSGTSFDLGTLTLTDLKLLGDAHLNNRSVRLTRDLPVPNSGAGRVLYSKPIRFRSAGNLPPVSFSTFFSFSVANLNPSSIGGGLAFLLAPDSDEIGLAGGLLGLAGESESDSAGFVAVEFDTLMDIEYGDINGNHVGLDLNSVVSSEVGDLETLGVDLKSGDLVNAWIDYDGSIRIMNVSVSYSNLKPEVPIISVELDLEQFVSDFMFVGFAGSTQGSTEVHSIEWWSFTSNSNSDQSPPLTTLTNPNPNPNVSDSKKSPISPSIPPEPLSRKTSTSKPSTWQRPGTVAGVTTAGAFLLSVVAGVLIWLFSKNTKSTKTTIPLTFPSEIIKSPREFSYKELKQATKCFNPNRVIGHGAFGTVYKGIISSSGDIIAVKRCISHTTQGRSEFLSELSIIGTLRHRNLVRLQGWCHQKDEILLVYEFMPNGSLDKALFETRSVLQWSRRRNILHGVASALAYLHQECENQVIHRDVKSSNIMLDQTFNARLGDFGLARQIEHDKSPDATVAAGTMGYLAPEYLLTGRASDKTDVFSFGAVILEVVTGRRPIESAAGSGRNLVEWVWGLHRDDRVLSAVDSRVENGEFEESEMKRVIMVGLVCSHPDPAARPGMRSVVQMLIGEKEVPEVPRVRPAASFSTAELLMTLQDSVSDCNAMIRMETSSSEEGSSFGDGEDIV